MTAAATIDPEERRTYIGASEAAAALGLSPWDDPVSVAMRKWGELPEKESTFRMKLGTMIEPLIGDLYRQETGRKLRAGGSKTRRMKGHPWIGAHPDFYVVGELGPGHPGPAGLVQAKHSNEIEGDLPVHYRLQGLVELAVVGGPWVDFAVLSARDFRILRVEPEPGEIEDLVADLDDYWHDYIVPKVVPPPSAESGAALRARYREAKEGIGKLANDAQVEKIAEYRRLADEEAAAKKAKEKLGNELKLAIGSAHFLEGGGYKATWSRWESDKVDWKAVATVYRNALQPLADDGVEIDGLPVSAILDATEGLYTTKEPGSRLTVTAPKEKA